MLIAQSNKQSLPIMVLLGSNTACSMAAGMMNTKVLVLWIYLKCMRSISLELNHLIEYNYIFVCMLVLDGLRTDGDE